MSDSGQRPSEPGAGNTDGGDESTGHPGPQVLDRALAILGLFRAGISRVDRDPGG